LTSGEDTYVEEEDLDRIRKPKPPKPPKLDSEGTKKIKLGPFKLSITDWDKKEEVKTEKDHIERDRGFKIERPEEAVSDALKPDVKSVEPESRIIDIEAASICPLCGDPITDKGTVCPFCEKEFHREHFLHWIRSKGYCPECGNKFQRKNEEDKNNEKKDFGSSLI
ncbi:MAG: hypothetical protein ACFFBD_29450, partial [Candidatus Hodarchaeota archaeon]